MRSLVNGVTITRQILRPQIIGDNDEEVGLGSAESTYTN